MKRRFKPGILTVWEAPALPQEFARLKSSTCQALQLAHALDCVPGAGGFGYYGTQPSLFAIVAWSRAVP